MSEHQNGASVEDARPAIDLPPLEVHPNGPLKGRTIRMRWPTTKMYLAIRSGSWTAGDQWQAILDAIVEHDLGMEPDELPPQLVIAIGRAWQRTAEETSLPQAESGS